MIVLAKREGLSSAAIGGFVALVRRDHAPRLACLAALPALPVAERDHAVKLLGGGGLRRVPRLANVYVLAGAFALQAFCFPNTDAAVAAYSYALIPDRLIGRAMAASNTLRAVAAPLGPLAAGLLLAGVSPRVAVAALMAPTLVAAAFGTVSKAIREAPPLEELTAAPD